MKIDVMKYWTEPPPEPSPGLLKWREKIRAGWTPNRRVRAMGYHEASEWFGVYIWEYIEVLVPMMYVGDQKDIPPE